MQSPALPLAAPIPLNSEALLASVFAASDDCIKILDLDGRIEFMTDNGMKLLQIPNLAAIRGLLWSDQWDGNLVETVTQAVASARVGLTSKFQGSSRTPSGTERFWDVRVSPVLNAAKQATSILALSRNITEQQHAAIQKDVLVHELEHRIKNILTMVVAISHQTLRPPATLATAADAFAARIAALGRAQSLLTRSNWEGSDIGTVVAGALEPHRCGNVADRLVIQGPAFDLSARRALSLIMALHELATNATKYGAFSTEAGHVAVTWAVAKDGDRSTLRLEWREVGGPPVCPPLRTGFGSRLLTRVLPADFDGSVRIDYDPGGVVLSLTAAT